MKCTCCGAPMEARRTDLPFKLGDTTIVVIRAVPVIECGNCTEYLIGDAEMKRIEELLERRATAVELEVVHFAA